MDAIGKHNIIDYIVIDKFLEWARSIPADRETNVNDNCKCPMALFAKDEYGFEEPRARSQIIENRGTGKSSDEDDAIVLKSFAFQDFGDCKTYGELVERLERRIALGGNDGR